MIEPPVITDMNAKYDYLRAVLDITKVWQAEVANRSDLETINRHIAKMWPLTFSPEVQQAILTEFMTRRLSR